VKLLFAASEIFPYAKTGGLADVASALPTALSKHIDVISVMPLYSFMQKGDFEKEDFTFSITLGAISYDVVIYSSFNQDIKTTLFKPLCLVVQKRCMIMPMMICALQFLVWL